MKKRQILWAIVFGAMLAITGCGDDSGTGGSGGSAGSGGTGGSAGTGGTAGDSGTGATGGESTGGDFCGTLCNSCAGPGAEQCAQECEDQITQIPGGIDFDSCPTELNALGNCLGANDCDGESCQNEYTSWFTCLISPF